MGCFVIKYNTLQINTISIVNKCNNHNIIMANHDTSQINVITNRNNRDNIDNNCNALQIHVLIIINNHDMYHELL